MSVKGNAWIPEPKHEDTRYGCQNCSTGIIFFDKESKVWLCNNCWKIVDI